MESKNSTNLEATHASHHHELTIASPIVNPRFFPLNNSPPKLNHHALHACGGERLQREHHGPRPRYLPLRAHRIHRQRHEYRRSLRLALRREIVVELVGHIAVVDGATGAGGPGRVEAGGNDKSPASGKEGSVVAKVSESEEGGTSGIGGS
ncbi:hypothetical protein AAHE18_03G197200 [Arachis hypogaea]